MKHVLLIENRPDFGQGGVETYNRHLYKILADYFENIQIDRAALLPCENTFNKEKLASYYHVFKQNANYRKKDGNFNFVKISFLFCFFRHLIYKLNKQNNYDLIIDSTITTFKKFRNKSFYFWIQHNTPAYYSMQHIKNKCIRKLFISCERIFGLQNNLIYDQNLILFDQYNYQEVKQLRNTSFNANIIPLSNYIPNDFNDALTKSIKTKQRILYFGRIDNEQKNIDLLIQLNNQLNLIDFYGKGNQNLIQKLGSSYKGFLDNDADLTELFTKYKFMIVMSNYEGFPFSLTQSLCYGLPIIVRGTFASAKFLTNNNKNGFLLPPNESADEYAQAIKKIYSINDEDYLKLSLNSYQFAKEHLSNEQFTQNWLKIFHQFLD